jgi:hypothetical protein
VTSVTGSLYGSEAGKAREPDKSRLQTNDMKFPASARGYSRAVKRGPENITEKLNTFGMNGSVSRETTRYRTVGWLLIWKAAVVA